MYTTSMESLGSVVNSSSSSAIQYFHHGMERGILLAYLQLNQVFKISLDSTKMIRATLTILEVGTFRNIHPKPHLHQELLLTDELITIGSIKTKPAAPNPLQHLDQSQDLHTKGPPSARDQFDLKQRMRLF